MTDDWFSAHKWDENKQTVDENLLKTLNKSVFWPVDIDHNLFIKTTVTF